MDMIELREEFERAAGPDVRFCRVEYEAELQLLQFVFEVPKADKRHCAGIRRLAGERIDDVEAARYAGHAVADYAAQQIKKAA